MPKIALLFTALLVASGCAQSRIAEWKDKDFTVCGNKYCDEECFKERVVQTCSGKATLMGGSSKNFVSNVDAYGNVHYGKSTCKQYTCSEALNVR